MGLIRTKLHSSGVTGDLLARPRLVERILDAGLPRLTLLQAPAGYGKTSLLAQWSRALRASRARAGWMSVDVSDRDPHTFLCYVSAALGAADMGVDAARETTPESLLAALINAMESQSQPLYLLIDDVHLLAPGPLAVLSRFIEQSPAAVKVVLASRMAPDMPLARMRGRGQLLELGAEELQLTAAETRQLVANASGRELPAPDLAALQARTGGWVTGIKFACDILKRGAGVQEMLGALTGSSRSVSDFFAAEVLAELPEEARRFLLHTSVLERLCATLCDAVTGRGNGRRMLDFIDRSGLFAVRLDEERNWYRYHPLFAEFLQRRQLDDNAAGEAQLHLAASRWLWDHDAPEAAIEHALRGADPQRAAELLELRCQDMTYRGKLRLVCRLADRIPQELLDRCPCVLMCRAWMLTLNLSCEEAREILQKVASTLEAHERAADRPIAEIRRLRYLLLHREMILAAAEDDAPRVEQQCRHLLDAFPEERHPYLVGTINAQLLYAQREQYQLSDLDRLTATAQGVVARSSYSFASIALQANVGPSLFFAGRTDAALRALEIGLSESMRYGQLASPLAALPALPMSEVLYERNELARAEELLQAALPSAHEFGFVDHLMSGYITSARIRHARGDRTGAQHTLDEGMGIAMARRLERLRLAIVAERVKFLLQEGHSEQAVRFARSAGIPQSCEHLLPRRGITTTDEWRAVAWFRIALSESRMQEALSVAKHWRSFCAAKGAVRSLIRWDLLLAQALFISSDVRAAQRALRDAMALGAAGRAIRTFIDEGAVIRTLLTGTYDAELDVLHPTDAFAAELLEIFDALSKKKPTLYAVPRRAPPEGLYGKLSVKEREILALVSTGMRNREVATKLGMTEGSVKWYMQQVYDKVGTRRRLQAVERARQFGVIA